MKCTVCKKKIEDGEEQMVTIKVRKGLKRGVDTLTTKVKCTACSAVNEPRKELCRPN